MAYKMGKSLRKISEIPFLGCDCIKEQEEGIKKLKDEEKKKMKIRRKKEKKEEE